MKLLFRIIFKIFLILTILAGCATTEEIKETDSDELLNQGIALFNESQYDRAIAYFNKAIEINPKLARAYYNRGLAYDDKGQHDKAISDYTKAIEIAPKLEVAYHYRGDAYENKGQYDRAISDYTKAIEINSRYADAYNNKAWLLATCRDTIYRDGAQAVELAKKAVKLDPNAMKLDTLAAAYAEVGKFEDAITTQEEAIDLLKKEVKPKNLIDQFGERLKSYKAHKPWREK
jgi:tetratricopeptide (TPR) repeat protein